MKKTNNINYTLMIARLEKLLYEELDRYNSDIAVLDYYANKIFLMKSMQNPINIEKKKAEFEEFYNRIIKQNKAELAEILEEIDKSFDD